MKMYGNGKMTVNQMCVLPHFCRKERFKKDKGFHCKNIMPALFSASKS